MKIQYFFEPFVLMASDQKGKCDKFHRSDWLTGNIHISLKQKEHGLGYMNKNHIGNTN